MHPLKHHYLFPVCLMLVSPLGILPVLPGGLFLVWLLMFQGILTFPTPSYSGLWSVCLFLDIFYDIIIGTTFLSFTMLYLGLDWGRKYLVDAPFFVLWGIATAVGVGFDALFFRAAAWQMLVYPKSGMALGAIVGTYPLIAGICLKVRVSQERKGS